MGSFSEFQCIKAFDGPASLLFSCRCWHLEKEAMVMAPPPTHDSAVSPCFHGCLAFLCRHFPPQSPPSHPLTPSLRSQQQPSPWVCSTIPKLQLPAAALTRWHVSLLGLCMAAVRTVWFSFHLGFHRSPVSLSALNGSPMTIALMWGSDHCFSSPTCRAGLVLLALLFLLLIPSSYRVLCGSKYSFLLVRFSCLLSAGVLHTLLCLKVYFWCIHGERCSPRPPIPLPSWSPNSLVFIFKFSVFLFWF